jgi:hypothetical protein
MYSLFEEQIMQESAQLDYSLNYTEHHSADA